jgi:hypothetical protein
MEGGHYKEPTTGPKIEWKGSLRATQKKDFNGAWIANSGFTVESGG